MFIREIFPVIVEKIDSATARFRIKASPDGVSVLLTPAFKAQKGPHA